MPVTFGKPVAPRLSSLDDNVHEDEGAVLTAGMRRHIREKLGPFDTGDPRWYSWLSEQLLRYGPERDSRTLLQDFLGRPVSPQPLLEEIHRLATTPSHSTESVLIEL